MPSKKREVQTFATRLNPALVRKLDVYAAQSNLSRNQVIEKLLERCFALQREVQYLRENERARIAHEPDVVHKDAAEVHFEIMQQQEDDIESQRMEAAEKIARTDFFDQQAESAPRKKSARRKNLKT